MVSGANLLSHALWFWLHDVQVSPVAIVQVADCESVILPSVCAEGHGGDTSRIRGLLLVSQFVLCRSSASLFASFNYRQHE
jgi:hypothetical protein